MLVVYSAESGGSGCGTGDINDNKSLRYLSLISIYVLGYYGYDRVML